MEFNLPCDRCREEQVRHVQEFHDKYDIKEEE
jgi:hypothetical protein